MTAEETSHASLVKYVYRTGHNISEQQWPCIAVYTLMPITRLRFSNIRKHLYVYRTMLKATVILLPLLGITWVFGILAVNQESSVFAWIFTIFNSLQVLASYIILHAHEVL